MVRIIIIILLSIQFCHGQISNSQFYFGRGLDSAAILTNDLSDSSITFRKIRYVNGPKLIGNPGSGYDSLKCIKLGTNLSFSNDTLNASGASGNVNQNGNSFGGTMVLGTNDNNTLELETNGVSRLGITSGATTGGEVTSTSITTNTSTFNNAFTIRANSTGTAAAGFGSSILFQGESSTTDNRDMIRLAARWETATDASRGSYLGIETVTAAGAILQRFKFTESGTLSIGSSSQAIYSNSSITTAASFTVGASSNALTLGGSSGNVSMVSSANSATACLINGTNTTTPCLKLGNTGYSGTADTKDMLYMNVPYTCASGTGYVNGVVLEPVYNLTGTASGQQNGIKINPTLTSLTAATFVGLYMTHSHANSYGIMQSGTAKNVFAGKTTIGSTTSPTSLLMLAAGTASANTAPLKFTSGTNLTTPEAGAVEYDASNLYLTNGSGIRFTVAKILSASATLDFGSTAAQSDYTLNITVTGAADGDEVILGVPSVAIQSASIYTAYVISANTVQVKFSNYDVASQNPPSGTFKVSVIKR